MKSRGNTLFTMLVLFVILLGGCAGNKAEELTDSAKVATEQDVIAIENKADGEDSFETYMGIFALFSGTPYDSTIEYVFILQEDTILEGYRNSEYIVSNIVDRRLENELLILELSLPENEDDIQQLTIEIAHDEAGNKILLFETGAALYPLTLTEFTDNGFTIPAGYEDWMKEFSL